MAAAVNVIVRCAVHGEMCYREAGHWYVCPGWDGELCCPAELAEHFAGPEMVLVPAPGSQPSQWGYRPAVVA
jgi:hypothetical protein